MKGRKAFIVTSLICLILTGCGTIRTRQQEKLNRAESTKAVSTSYETEAPQLLYEIDRLAKEVGAFLGQCLNLDLHYTTCGNRVNKN